MSDATSREANDAAEEKARLEGQAQNWATPRVAEGEYTRDGGEKGSERLTLEGEARMWSTPDANVFADGFQCTPQEWAERRARLKEAAKNGNGCGTPLAMEATLWTQPESSATGPTIRAADGCQHQLRTAESVLAGLVEQGRTHSQRIEDFVAMWSTPTSRDHKDGTNPATVETNALLGREAPRWSLPPHTLPDPVSGSGSCVLTAEQFDSLVTEMRRRGARFLRYDPSSPRLSLNPIFVAWLMGWPMSALGI